LLAFRLTTRSAAALLALVFAAVAVWVVVIGALPGDRWALRSLYGRIGSSIDEPMGVVEAITDTLALSVVVVVISGVVWVHGRRQDALWFLLGVAVVLAANPALKEIVGRSRPDIRPPPESVSSLSFPSGHAAGTAALVGALLMVAPGPRVRHVIVILGAGVLGLVAFSVLALTVHFPSDIVAGWSWAGAWIGFVWSAKQHHDRSPRTTDRSPHRDSRRPP
jgi:membrane-associated phospholipid phosphatase